jgi:hypothetical protein
MAIVMFVIWAMVLVKMDSALIYLHAFRSRRRCAEHVTGTSGGSVAKPHKLVPPL